MAITRNYFMYLNPTSVCIISFLYHKSNHFCNCYSSKKKSHGSKKHSGMSVLKETDDEEENAGGITIKASSNTNKGFSIVE
jgi:hypothetical protein